MLEEQKRFEDEIRRQLKLQGQVHTDHIQDALAIKEQEADRKLKRALSEQTEKDSLKYKSQLAAIVGRLRGLEAALKGEYLFEFNLENIDNYTRTCVYIKRATFPICMIMMYNLFIIILYVQFMLWSQAFCSTR